VNNETLRVYIADPYTSGEGGPDANVHRAIDAGDQLLNAGIAPFVPHLSHFWNAVCPHSWDVWMAFCFAWIPVCQAMVRIPGESKGAGLEVKLATELGIPVFCAVEECLAWVTKQREATAEMTAIEKAFWARVEGSPRT
jgi:hypothetical protein